jgi:hypothetical protein
MRYSWLVSCSIALLSCGSSIKTQRLPDGTLKVICKSSLEQCKRSASEVCGRSGHRVVAGTSENKLFGTPGNQVSVGQSEVIIACGDLAARPAKAPPPATSTRVCTPGSTLRCYGPAACIGGQACLPDGSGFGACDCGSHAGADPSAPVLDAGPD